ncbi:hypothetical protein N7U66_17805 [Lacinutrix neustonica]|uniref:Tetratricopeptide repeat protein n=1 Tax=Lacinutrix neustonica TaxID=2980107 RepID=A0A9E8SDY7_9FLAO|nr:hypothetical protein [Lacinutrix neustonica]WAC01729.1 hypothetical protein N7U66_17805 [Lacinutrix neustonica]
MKLDLLQNCNKRIENYYDINGKYPLVFQNFDDTPLYENIKFVKNLNGIITFCFIVNCEGQPGSFVVHQLDSDFQPKKFSPQVIEELKKLILELPISRHIKNLIIIITLLSRLKMAKSKIYYLSLILIICSCSDESIKKTQLNNDEISEKYLKNCAWQNNLHSEKWQVCIDSAISKNSNIAYLYQQKAMPYLKTGDYYNGMKNLDIAVRLSPNEYCSYRGFMKVIFMKDYDGAILDFLETKNISPGEYIMDHDVDFFLGLCFLMKKEYTIAEDYLNSSLLNDSKHGEDWIHYSNLYYYAIVKYKVKDYDESLITLDRCLKIYPNFANAIYLKAKIMDEKKLFSEAYRLSEKAMTMFNKGFVINESNEIYVNYPYQISMTDITNLKDKIQYKIELNDL